MTSRHLTTAATLLVLVGILVLGAVVGVKAMFEPVPAGDASASVSPSPTCTTQDVKKGHKIRSKQVAVSVFNAGTRARLAERTLTGLGKRGFKRGEAGNAPGTAKVRAVQVWTTTKEDAAAKLVARQFGRKTKVKVTDTDLGPGVDVLVGNAFRGLVKAPHSLTVRTSQQVCLPTGS